MDGSSKHPKKHMKNLMEAWAVSNEEAGERREISRKREMRYTINRIMWYRVYRDEGSAVLEAKITCMDKCYYKGRVIACPKAMNESYLTNLERMLKRKAGNKPLRLDYSKRRYNPDSRIKMTLYNIAGEEHSVLVLTWMMHGNEIPIPLMQHWSSLRKGRRAVKTGNKFYKKSRGYAFELFSAVVRQNLPKRAIKVVEKEHPAYALASAVKESAC